MSMLLNMHMTIVLFSVQFNNFALITGFIGAIHSYSIRLFLWAFGRRSNCIPVGDGLYTQFTGPFPCFVQVLGLACETGHTLQARASRFFIGFGTAFCVSTFLTLDVTRHQHTWRVLLCRSYLQSNTGDSEGLDMRLRQEDHGSIC